MIIDEIKNIKSSNIDLRKFGISVGLVIAFIGLYLLVWEKASSKYFLAAGALLIIPGLLFPKVLKPLQKIWMTLAILLGWLSTRIILSFLYYFIMTPIGLFLRVSGKDLLDKKIQKGKASYWNYREIKTYDPGDSEKQF